MEHKTLEKLGHKAYDFTCNWIFFCLWSDSTNHRS